MRPGFQPSPPAGPPPGPAQPTSFGDRLIPTKNPPALIAYYCGVFSCACGLLLGPIAIILGVLGLKRIKQQPDLPGKGHALAGIILGSISIVLWAVIIIALANDRPPANIGS